MSTLDELLAELEAEELKNIRLAATDRTDKSTLVSLVSSEQENKKSLFPDRATDAATLWRVTYPDRVITVACSEAETLATIEAATVVANLGDIPEVLSSKVYHLAAIHALPTECWPAAVALMLAGVF
jgi:hypothetical protein